MITVYKFSNNGRTNNGICQHANLDFSPTYHHWHKKENVEDAVQKALEIFDQNYYVSFNVVVCLLIYSAISSLKEEESTYFKFIQTLQTKETEIIGFNPKIFELFGKYLSNKEDRYLLNIMVEQKLIDSNILPKNISREHISSNKFYASSFGNVRFGLPQDTNSDSDQNNSSVSTSMENYFNGFSYQQKLYKEASPSEIANIIRNDDVEKLQEISSQTNFPLNQNIKKTLFERSKLLRSSCISLVDYAAFYGSIKCFKYLLLNGADISQTGKFAVAGGNIEIIKLCEQNHSSFADSYQAAIEFHQNDVFYYIYENKLEKFEDNKRYFPGFVSKFFLGNTLPRDTNTSDELKRLEEELGSACVKHNNYEILLYLVKEGLEIIDYYINHAIASGNLFLVKYFLENNKIANNKILLDNFSVENVELIKYLIGIDINIKDIYLFDLMVILIISYLKILFENYLKYLKMHLY